MLVGARRGTPYLTLEQLLLDEYMCRRCRDSTVAREPPHRSARYGGR